MDTPGHIRDRMSPCVSSDETNASNLTRKRHHKHRWRSPALPPALKRDNQRRSDGQILMLRYFGSREAILLAQEYDAWVDAVCDALPRAGEPDQVKRVSGVLAATAAEQPLLCELLIAAPTVLEHNVTSDEVIAFKLAVQASMQRLLVALTTDLGEWDPPPGINSSAACTPSSLVCGRSPTPPRRSSRPWPASHASRPYHTGWRPPPVKHSPP